MDFIEHTATWVKGEAFLAGLVALMGGTIVLWALYLWRFGQSETSRALVIPLLVVGVLASVGGGIGRYNQAGRVERLRAAHDEDPKAFVQAEKERVDGFIGLYRYLFAAWSALILVGLALFFLWGGNLGRAIGMTVALTGVSLLLIDHISQNNALAYNKAIHETLGGT